MATDEDVGSARREHIDRDVALVERARTDDPDAFGELYELWFERVYDLAYRITRDRDTAAEVAQEAFLSAWRQLGRLERADAFGGWLLRITRNTAFNRQRKEQRSSPRDAEGMAMIETGGPRADAPTGFRVEDRAGTLADPAKVAEDHELVDLVWESAEALGTTDAEVLDLTLRHGFTPAEIGDVIGVNRNAANQTVHRVRKRLRAAVEARVLWRGGEPACGDLADALAEASITRFDGDAVRVTSEHAETCELCSRRRTLKLEPSALFAATPFLAVPLVKQEIAHALAAQGVPLARAAAQAGDELDGDELDSDVDSQPGDGHGGRRRLARRVGAAGVVVIAALLAVGVVLAEQTDEAGVRATRADVTRETTLPSTTVAPTLPTTPIAEGPSATGAPRVVAPPVLPPEQPPPPPPPVSGGISINPMSSAGSIFPRPTLSWNTTNAVSVQVSGPSGFSSTQANGSASVCPGSPLGPDCNAANGSYTYTVRATDTTGAVVFERSVTFTVG
jgi:RNA polymerase sigma factor (sigma-70 family)